MRWYVLLHFFSNFLSLRLFSGSHSLFYHRSTQENAKKNKNHHLKWTYMGKHNNSTLKPTIRTREKKKLGYLIMMWFYYVLVRLDGVCRSRLRSITDIANTLNNNVGDDKCVFHLVSEALKFRFNLGADGVPLLLLLPSLLCDHNYNDSVGNDLLWTMSENYSYSDASEFLTHVISGKIAVCLFVFFSLLYWVFWSFLLYF